MDGLDCVKQYRAWEKEHRPQFHQIIIGISAHVSCEESGQGIEAGMDDFRPKPISIKTLTELSVTDAVVSQTALLDQLEGPACCSVDDADAAAEGHVQAMQAAATVLENDNKMAVEGVENRMSESATKRTRREQGSSTRSPNNDTQIPVALIAMDTPTLKSNEFMKVLESNGWKVVVVHDGKDALRLMQMRNWDVVLVDDDIPNLPAIQCIAEFREWEANSRVNEQKNVFIVCDCDIPSLRDTSSVVQPPFGFNGVLQKPVVLDELAFLLKERSTNLNILVRK